MPLLIGITHSTPFTAGACYYPEPPELKIKGMPLPYLRRKLLGVAIVLNEDPQTAINTVIHRVFEKLTLRGIENEELLRSLTLVGKPALKKNRYILPFVPAQNHWLITVAERAISEWKERDLWLT
jgi:hypothetical protein